MLLVLLPCASLTRLHTLKPHTYTSTQQNLLLVPDNHALLRTAARAPPSTQVSGVTPTCP
jgi:hypothetical protein